MHTPYLPISFCILSCLQRHTASLSSLYLRLLQNAEVWIEVIRRTTPFGKKKFEVSYTTGQGSLLYLFPDRLMFFFRSFWRCEPRSHQASVTIAISLLCKASTAWRSHGQVPHAPPVPAWHPYAHRGLLGESCVISTSELRGRRAAPRPTAEHAEAQPISAAATPPPHQQPGARSPFHCEARSRQP